MPKPNYQGEKRRKDLAKQAKKKEKMARKLNRSHSAGPSTEPAAEVDKPAAE